MFLLPFSIPLGIFVYDMGEGIYLMYESTELRSLSQTIVCEIC